MYLFGEASGKSNVLRSDSGKFSKCMHTFYHFYEDFTISMVDPEYSEREAPTAWVAVPTYYFGQFFSETVKLYEN